MFSNNFSGKKVLVTGHTGFKGSWLTAWLQKLDTEVVGISLVPDTNPSHFMLLNLDMESHFFDIRDYDKLSIIIQKINPNIIFHLAAQPLVRASYEKPLDTFTTNIIGTANLLNACRSVEALQAVVVITSDKCYENREIRQGYRETDPMGGYDPYSASKGCAELITASFRNSFFNLDDFGRTHQNLVASARAGNVIGGGDWARDRLIPDIARAIEAKIIMQIRNPNAVRPWQHVLECLCGYLKLGAKLLQGDKRFAEAWNFAPTDEGTATVLDIVSKMQINWPEFQYNINKLANQPYEANLLQLDCYKANTILQWKNVWNLDKTIEMIANWYSGYYENGNIETFNDIENYIKSEV